jgi:hypothetical protein
LHHKLGRSMPTKSFIDCGCEVFSGVSKDPKNDFFFGVFFVWVLFSQGFGGGLGSFFSHRGLSVTTSIVPRTNFLVPAFTRFNVLAAVEEEDEDFFELLE